MTFPEKNDQAFNVYILKQVFSQFKLPFKLPGHCLWLVKLWKRKFETLCAIWHRSNSQQNVKNIHGAVFFSVKLQALLIVTLLHGCFSRFLDCTNGTKSRNASHLPRVRKTYRSLTHIYPMLTFYIPWIHQKTQRFLVFSVGI